MTNDNEQRSQKIRVIDAVRAIEHGRAELEDGTILEPATGETREQFELRLAAMLRSAVKRSSQIQVVCASPAHPTKVAKIEAFLIGADGSFTARRRRVFDEYGRQDKPVQSRTFLVGDVEHGTGDTDADDATRSRYAFECPLCHDKVPVRWENLEPILAKAAKHGVFDLPLSVIRPAASTM